MFKRRFDGGDMAWMVKVTQTGGIYAKQIRILVIDSRRISVAQDGKRVTWSARRVKVFGSAPEALRAAVKHLVRQQAKEAARRPAVRAA